MSRTATGLPGLPGLSLIVDGPPGCCSDLACLLATINMQFLAEAASCPYPRFIPGRLGPTTQAAPAPTVFWKNCGSATCHKPRRILSPNDLIKRAWWLARVRDWSWEPSRSSRRGGKETGRISTTLHQTTSDSLLTRPEDSTLSLSVYRPPLHGVRTETSLLVFLFWPTVCPSVHFGTPVSTAVTGTWMASMIGWCFCHGPAGHRNPSTPRQTGG